MLRDCIRYATFCHYEFMIADFVGIAGWFFGGLDGFVKRLISCTVIDYIT